MKTIHKEICDYVCNIINFEKSEERAEFIKYHVIKGSRSKGTYETVGKWALDTVEKMLVDTYAKNSAINKELNSFYCAMIADLRRGTVWYNAYLYIGEQCVDDYNDATFELHVSKQA